MTPVVMDVCSVEMDDVARLYEQMFLIRTTEELVGRLAAEGRVAGAHLSIGQEACAVGVVAALEPDDYLFSTHRGHGHALAKGVPLERLLGELLGKATGLSHGRGGSMHAFDRQSGFFGTTGIVGGAIPLAVGAAYAAQVLADGRVSAIFLGDGAAAQGVFHESLNLASIWRLPVVFLCESNGFAELTPSSAHLSAPVASYPTAHGITAETVDGTDVLAVRAAARRAVARSRAGEGPSFVEMVTRRIVGHFAGDRQEYRSAADLANARSLDSVLRTRRLLDASPAGERRAIDIEGRVAERVGQALAAVADEPEPAIATLLDGVW